MVSREHPHDAEWLEADGLGGFASGTVSGRRTRRYHALLLTATSPPTGRLVLVNGFDAWVETPEGAAAISSQAYVPGVIHPDGADRLESFSVDPWPRWRFRLPGGAVLEQEVFVPKGRSACSVTWRISGAGSPARLLVRPFFSGRDYHATHHRNGAFGFEPRQIDGALLWKVYDSLPAVVVSHNGTYHHEPAWYDRFLYEQERERGLDDTEDLASPGTFRWDLSQGEAVLLLAAEGHLDDLGPGVSAAGAVATLRAAERARRAKLPAGLERAADAYLVRRGAGRTIVAGYPWFTDWGRDTFVALRGLCLATGRLEEARGILTEWATAVSEGMLPNLFPDGSATPEYNSVDASLWYVVAAGEYLRIPRARKSAASESDRKLLQGAMEAILDGYARGTRFGIRLDADGLLAAGQPGVQLTWMDAKVGDRVVTPRVGKPVEVQALWLNALGIAAKFTPRWNEPLRRGLDSFAARFWNEERGCLYDVVDCDHRPGTVDPSLRPNQILAVGGLPRALLQGERARRLVDEIERSLLTPVGLRSLAPTEPGYAGRYLGGPRERDGVYHQGTVWPWLLGPFVEAWVRVRGNTAAARRAARARFLPPLLAHLNEAGLEHVSEIADGDPPHTPRGCPFQAWSVGEALRLDKVVLKASTRRSAGAAARPPKPSKPATSRPRPPKPGARGRPTPGA